MSKFKVTLRRNGKPVGEMSYPSEAVAVTQAKAMKDATGCAVSVAPAKANPPAKTRAPRDAAYWVRSAVSALDAGAPTSAADDIRKALRLLPANSPVEEILMRAIQVNSRLGSDRSAVYPLLERALRHFGPRRSGAKANPRRAVTRRRNPTVLWTPQGPAYEAHEPTRWTSVEVESRNGGKTYEVVAYGYADGREVRSVRAFGSKTPEGARRYADEVRRELRVRENPRRNGHLCNPGCGCTKSNPAQFAFDDHFQRLFIRSHPGAIWAKAPHHKGGSPAAYLRQIEALVADGSMSERTAVSLRKQMKDAGFVPQSNPRRRNGTSYANIAASTSLVRSARLIRNAAIEIG